MSPPVPPTLPPDPVIVEVLRGGIVESRHEGAYAVTGPGGALVAAAGDIHRPVYPRSAIKAFQCLPVIETGAADRFGFTDEEIALSCSSHNGEARHVAVARAMLAKLGLSDSALECGTHWPLDQEAQRALARLGETPDQAHNNCSGKHAGMLALALALGVARDGYVNLAHPVQQSVARVMGEMCEADVDHAPCGIDGCSVPTWALPLERLALGFQRLASGESLAPERAAACRRIIAAVRAHPFMVAGTRRFCTDVMTAVPRLFVKTGAEGVFCAAVPHAGIGIALKCDDGAGRGAEAALAGVLLKLDVWTDEERAALARFARFPLRNWKRTEVGEVRAVV
jgi:L-asparaginase II